MIKDLHTLPTNLPIPQDDGACDHLPGSALPALAWMPASAYTGTVVIYCYPMLGRPDSPPLVGWNDIPGARGCTPQSCAFRDAYAELKQLGAELLGVSAQPPQDQQEAHARLRLPFALLHDREFALTRALKLPTFDYGELRLIKRLTMIATAGVIRKVFYPVFPPDQNAADVIDWLRENPQP